MSVSCKVIVYVLLYVINQLQSISQSNVNVIVSLAYTTRKDL